MNGEIDGIVVCIGLSEDLEKTLPWNAKILHHMVVVTGSKDKATAKVAKRHGAELVICDKYDRGADSFNKGVLLNAALDRLKPVGWKLFLDADILLSPSLAELDTKTLDTNVLYYTTRRQIQTEREFATAKRSWDAISALPYGFAVQFPYGYFQLWHPGAVWLEAGQRISERFPTAGGVDQWWALRWPRSRWARLPGGHDVGHLSHGYFGERWHGPNGKDLTKWRWAGWSRGERLHIEPMPNGGVFRLIALDTSEEMCFQGMRNVERLVKDLRKNGSTEQIDIYWKAAE